MATLIQLEAEWIRYETRIDTWEQIIGDHKTWRERGCPCQSITGPKVYKIIVPTFAEAQGIWFICPKCANDHQHHVEVSFAERGVLPDQGVFNKDGQQVLWRIESGNSFDNLTLKPSILIQGGCDWHGYITNGKAE